MVAGTVITNIYPNVGELYGYTSVDISGNGFTEITSVLFTDTNSNVYDVSFTVISDNLINAVTPYSLTEQTMQVTTVGLGGFGTSNPVNFYFRNQARLYGLQYALGASGGFYIEEGFPSINLAKLTPLAQYDVTNALQVAYDVRKFNQMIGIIKDPSNHYILETSFNQLTESFPLDSITIDASNFVGYMSHDQVISVGTYSTLYSNFNLYVNSYFSYGGFTPLFDCYYNSTGNYDLYNGIFDASSFIHIINEKIIDPSNSYVKAVTGSITINGINNALLFLVNNNPYHNRNKIGQPFSTPSDDIAYCVADGFVDGDLIYVPSGTNITLKLLIVTEPTGYTTYAASHDFSNNNLMYTEMCEFNTKYGDSNYTSHITTTASNETIIQQTLTAPLLIKLENLSTNPYEYGHAYVPPPE